MFVFACLALSDKEVLHYEKIPGAVSGSGRTTRYWDCCKPSCSWSGKAAVSSPVASCAKDGSTKTAIDAKSGCDGGPSYMCANQIPRAVNSSYAVGFAAASVAGWNEARACCSCIELTFTSGACSGKKFAVQITNTGSDLGSNQFDLAIPGGGVGIFNGCTSQYGAPADGWGSRYGGVPNKDGCKQLPAALQPGCEFRFDFMGGADNPSVSFTEITCPSQLTGTTGCTRN
jgi:hypothetical protein